MLACPRTKQLLVWVGSGRGEHLSLATHGGDTLLASWDFGSGQQQLRVAGPRPSPELVTLSLSEAGVMQLTVDGASRARSVGSGSLVFPPSPVYLGGAPDTNTITGGRYQQGWAGCLQAVRVLGDSSRYR